MIVHLLQMPFCLWFPKFFFQLVRKTVLKPEPFPVFDSFQKYINISKGIQYIFRNGHGKTGGKACRFRQGPFDIHQCACLKPAVRLSDQKPAQHFREQIFFKKLLIFDPAFHLTCPHAFSPGFAPVHARIHMPEEVMQPRRIVQDQMIKLFITAHGKTVYGIFTLSRPFAAFLTIKRNLIQTCFIEEFCDPV